MVKCDMGEYQSDFVTQKYYQGQYYCPEFSEQDELYNNYRYEESSELRWEV